MTPHISEDGEIAVGMKKTTVFLVDAKTGRVVHTYGLDNSPSILGSKTGEENALLLVKDAELTESTGSDLQTVQHLVYIARTDYVLQHYSPNSTEVLWNVAFADIGAEFHCQGFKGSLGGVPLADEVRDDAEFPCQMKTSVLRIRDYNSLEFDKLAIAHLGGGPRFLPAPMHVPSLGPVSGLPLALPVNEDRHMLTFPSYEAKTPDNLLMLSGNKGAINSTTSSSEIIAKSQMWPIIAAIVSIMSSVIYSYLTYRKQSKLDKPMEESKLQAAMPKRKKSKKMGNHQ